MSFGNFRRGGRGKRRTPGTMNGLETAWAEVLTSRVQSGTLLWWKFEGITLKIAPDTRLTCDFATQMPDGEIVLYETKGFMEGDAHVKLKVAAENFPFRIIVVTKRAKKDGGGFLESEVGK